MAINRRCAMLFCSVGVRQQNKKDPAACEYSLFYLVIVGLQRIVNGAKKRILWLLVVFALQKAAQGTFLAVDLKITGPGELIKYLISIQFLASWDQRSPGNQENRKFEVTRRPRAACL